MRYIFYAIALCVATFTLSFRAGAQCNSWNVTVMNVYPSDCIANGGFTVQLSGADLPNLSNIKFSIPLTSLGFYVQPNSSPVFANIPAGTYTVKIEASCSAGSVSKNATVTIGGSYLSPTLLAVQQRGSLSCGSYGQIWATMTGSSFPYTIKLLSYPGAYNGPVSVTTTAAGKLLDSLPAGTYTLQVVDTCGTATVPQPVTISSLNVASIPLDMGGLSKTGTGCNQLQMYKPSVAASTDPQWAGYYMADSLFEVAYSINGGTTISPFEPMDYMAFPVTLPPGKTYKDLYGSSYLFYIKPPCGAIYSVTRTIGQPYLQLTNIPRCSSGFTEEINLHGTLFCYPVAFALKNKTTNINYGPYAYNGGSLYTPVLPYGNYDITYTTADGYTGTSTFIANAPSANPYNVTVYTDNQGLNNYISRFSFYYSAGTFISGTSIKLISGPAGYTYQAIVSGNTSNYVAYHNQSPVINNNIYFIPGTYVWQIKDSCGTYTVTTHVPSSMVYNYTLNINNRQQTCNGLIVYPSGSCSYNGNNNWPVYFKILSGPPGASNAVVPQGGFMTLSAPGTYVIGVSASPNDVGSYGTYPNAYQVMDTIVYDHQPLTVDVNNTQGFLCIGASAGQGQIGIKGLGGMPYKWPASHYKYYLAAAGNGVTGPYLSNNTTGYFSGMGMNVGDIYDLKIVDSCGAFVTHQVKILDLSTAQLAAANASDICEGETLELYALPLPAAIYSWTGPGGFSSNLQKPVINNVGIANSGQYTVTITTVHCPLPASSSVSVVVHPNPAKATIGINCINTTAVLTAGNVTGADYQWYKNSNLLSGQTNTVFTVTQAGNYFVRTIFPATGCSTASDTILFTGPPGVSDTPVITTTQTILCENDTAVLTAKTKYPAVSYQWYLNGLPLAGAIDSSIAIAVPGKYTVETSTGPCSHNVSDTIIIETRIPVAILRPLGDTVFCEGAQVTLFGNMGTGLSYTWNYNGNSIPQALGNIFTATETGIYTFQVFNGYCTATSNTVQVTVNENPIASISPGGDVYLCEGENIQLTTPPGAGYHYTWMKDGIVIAGETTSTYTTSVAGKYTVITGNNKCPDDTSSINLYIVPYPLADIMIDGPVAFCEGLSTVLKLPYQPNCTYVWYKNGNEIYLANGTDYVVSSSGRYKALVTNHHCITVSEEVAIMVHPAPHPLITRNDQLLNTGIYATYQWLLNAQAIAGGTGQNYHLLQPGYYTVQVTDSNGCSGSSDTTDVVSVDEGCIVRLPSAFTPNNDGKNDVFKLIGLDGFSLEDFRVLNRWGQAVFSTTDSRQGWNGSFNGIAQETGTYFYFVKYRCNNETKVRAGKGDVLLVR